MSIYDHLGYVLVGAVALLVIYADSVLIGINIPSFDLTSSPLWLLASYFFGHVIQAISNILVKEKYDVFAEADQQILKSAKEIFGTNELSDNEAWNLCYLLAMSKGFEGHVQAFNANYGLYRGWFTVFAMESLFLAAFTIRTFSITHLAFLALSIIFSILFYRRSKRFFAILRRKVLQIYLLTKAVGAEREEEE